MARRTGINISGHYVVSTNAMPFHIYTLNSKKNERSDRIVFHIVLKTKRLSDTGFTFGSRRIHPNGCKFKLN